MKSIFIIDKEKFLDYVNDFLDDNSIEYLEKLETESNINALNPNLEDNNLKNFKDKIDNLEYDIARFKMENSLETISNEDLKNLIDSINKLKDNYKVYKYIVKLMDKGQYKYIERLKEGASYINREIKVKITLLEIILNLQPSYPSNLYTLANRLKEENIDVKELMNLEINKEEILNNVK